MKTRNKRVLLKLSGEMLGGSGGHGIDFTILKNFTQIIKEIVNSKIEIGIVVGGGNIFRGIKAEKVGLSRVTGDYMGMLATNINGLAIQNCFVSEGIPTKVMSAIEVGQVVEPINQKKAIQYLEDGNVVIFSGGTGNPFFSTDTAAALRALEIEADSIIKITRVDGIYNKDPITNPDAVFYPEITFETVLKENLKVMDQTAFALCRDNGISIIVINFNPMNNLKKVLQGDKVGSIVIPDNL